MKEKGDFMLEEEKRERFKHGLCTFLAALIGGFLAFYVVMDITLARMLNPMYGIKRAEKMLQHQMRDIQKFDNEVFTPTPMPLHHSIITMLKEDNVYKFVVDLKQLDNNEKNIEVVADNDTITIKGVAERNRGNKNILIDFSQTFALDTKIYKDKITKKREGNKYIIMVPTEA